MKLYFMTGILLTHKFELLNLKMKTLIKVDKTLKALEEHRRIHSSLLETIKVFDRIFDPDILLSLLATAVHVVLLLFLAMIMLTTFHGTTQWHWFFYQLTFTSLGFVSFLRIAGTAVVGDRLAGKAS
ncbi:hypothetical protein QYM36_013319 [Artemia franciscana]|uniref:Uncharacterized protein n=1 Tax=Artemia franciscana TaxID=6661 RepID=A0AA88HIG9_ARTSF|nr:hypothetical protein QYM36_013319 [Artemia franciscana]